MACANDPAAGAQARDGAFILSPRAEAMLGLRIRGARRRGRTESLDHPSRLFSEDTPAYPRGSTKGRP
jgi:hypothetical protein